MVIGRGAERLVALGDRALVSTDGMGMHYSVQRRHDGSRWVNVAHFAGRDDAKAATGALIGHDDLTEGDLRVKRVTREIV